MRLFLLLLLPSLIAGVCTYYFWPEEKPEAKVYTDVWIYQPVYSLDRETCIIQIRSNFIPKGAETAYATDTKQVELAAAECAAEKDRRERAYCTTVGPQNYEEFKMCDLLKNKD